MKKAAQEEKLRPPKSSKDEMPPPPSLQGFLLMLFLSTAIDALLKLPTTLQFCEDALLILLTSLELLLICYFMFYDAQLLLLARKDIIWEIISHLRSLQSSWLPAMMLLHRKLPRSLLRGTKFRLIILVTDCYLKWDGEKVNTCTKIPDHFILD